MRAIAPILLAAALTVCAQQPRFENAHVVGKAIEGNLNSALKSSAASQNGPAWTGYAVPMLPGDRQLCGWDGAKHSGNHLSLEGPSTLFVLFRTENGEISKVRTATPDCELDGGGLPVTWLTGVQPVDSVRFLTELSLREQAGDSALAALAWHRDPSAVTALVAMLAPDVPERRREKAIQWLSLTGQQWNRLIQVARQDPSPRVRGQALFWLSQGAQKKLALETIAGAVDNDPETEVKKKAIFALAQLPSGEGVPKLIEVARSNRNSAVRKQAMFWLGQSKDPRALSFIEEVLTR